MAGQFDGHARTVDALMGGMVQHVHTHEGQEDVAYGVGHRYRSPISVSKSDTVLLYQDSLLGR